MSLKSYTVSSIKNQELLLNGKGDSKLWEEAFSLTDFSSPWKQDPIAKIEFKAIHNQTHLYCRFRVADPNVYVDTTDDTKDSINESDRVELFFRSNEKLDPYFCLEIDPTARLMDFKARPQRAFDFDWNWPVKDIEIQSSVENDYFTVEIAITLDSLSELGLLKGNRLETGIYRAKYKQQADETYEPTWITWVDPKTEVPDFHIASSFGCFIFEGI
ncbi:MAG: carbohydrate-binding family 9-like protein [Flavicella sp.]